MSDPDIRVYGELPDQTPRQALARMKAAGWTLEQFGFLRAAFEPELQAREERGETGELSCHDFRIGMLDALDRTFVQWQHVHMEDVQAMLEGSGLTDQAISDFNLGRHAAGCPDRACQLLGEAYWSMRGSEESDISQNLAMIDSLRELFEIPRSPASSEHGN